MRALEKTLLRILASPLPGAVLLSLSLELEAADVPEFDPELAAELAPVVAPVVAPEVAPEVELAWAEEPNRLSAFLRALASPFPGAVVPVFSLESELAVEPSVVFAAAAAVAAAVVRVAAPVVAPVAELA